MGFRFLVHRDARGCIEPLERAESLWHGAGRGAAWETAVLEQYTCWALWWSGELPAFRARRDAGLREARLNAHRYRETVLGVAFPQTHLMNDAPGAALEEIAAAAAAWRPTGKEFSTVDFWALESRTWIWLYAGEMRGVEELERDWETFARSLLGRVRVLASMREWLCSRIALLRARDADARGERTEARRQRARALRLALRHGKRDEVAGKAIAQATAALSLASGDVEAGLAGLRTAADVYTRFGALALAACCRWRLGEWLGGDEGRSLRSDADEWLAERGVRNPAALVRMLTAVESP